jgi:hypothetical protein
MHLTIGLAYQASDGRATTNASETPTISRGIS